MDHRRTDPIARLVFSFRAEIVDRETSRGASAEPVAESLKRSWTAFRTEISECHRNRNEDRKFDAFGPGLSW